MEGGLIDAFASSLILPALALAGLGWVIPRLLALVFPEGIKPLIVLTLVSIAVMCVVSLGLFVVLYVAQGLALGTVFADGAFAHFMRLVAISGLLWGPLMVLSVANLPRHWKEVEW